MLTVRGDLAPYTEAQLRRLAGGPLVRRLEFVSETPSTNDLALRRVVEDGAELPLLVLAERQTAGRGRGANRWVAADGALTFSLGLDTEAMRLPQSHWPRLSLCVGLAVCEGLAAIAPRLSFGLKWPNDIFLAGRKIAGVLVEPPPRRPDRLVVGVGVNVNNSLDDAPAEVRSRAVSLSSACGAAVDRVVALESILRFLERRLSDLAAGDEELARRWAELNILADRPVAVEAGPRRVEGICRGIAPDGALALETARGIERLHSGVVASFD